MRLLLLALTAASAAIAADSKAPADDAAEFARTFSDRANMVELISKIDGLIDLGESRILEANVDPRTLNPIPAATTANGIQMIYTLRRSGNAIAFHFSVARAEPFSAIPPAIGRQIVGMFTARVGLPQESMAFSIADDRIYNAGWSLPEANYQRVAAFLKAQRVEIRKPAEPAAILADAVARGERLVPTLPPGSFAAGFYAPAQIQDYVAKIDALIDLGEARPFANPEAQKTAAGFPEVRTANGLRLLYTITHTGEGVIAHLSMSLPSSPASLAAPLGRHLVGLFMSRSGREKPSTFSISPNNVYHTIWLIPEADFERSQASLLAARAALRKESNPSAAMVAAMKSAESLPAPPAPAAAKAPSP